MPQLVLVHGAFQGGWVWHRISPELILAGHEIYCPTLSGLEIENSVPFSHEIGLNKHVEDICRVLDDNKLVDVVLLGHSYGGMVISGVAKLRPALVRKMIYLDAPIPNSGDCLLDILGPDAKNFFYENVRQNGTGWRVDPFAFSAFGLEKSEDIAWSSHRHVPQALKSFIEPVTSFNLGELAQFDPSYICCLKAGEFSRTQAKKAQATGWSVYEIDTPHCPMITHPKELVETLLQMLNL